MESKLPPNHQVFHNRGFYYFTFIIPITLIYIAVFIFYYKNKSIPYFEEVGNNLPEKRFIEVAFNVCAWIMLTTLLTTDGAIQARNKKYQQMIYGNLLPKPDLKYSISRFFECIFAGITFLSCIAYGSILISDSMKYHFICGVIFLLSSSLYFSLVNLLFKMIRMNTKKEITPNDKSSICLIDWIHSTIAPICFIFAYLLKTNRIGISMDVHIKEIVAKSMQYIGITLLFSNFVRILLRMPILNIFLLYKKKE